MLKRLDGINFYWPSRWRWQLHIRF